MVLLNDVILVDGKPYRLDACGVIYGAQADTVEPAVCIIDQKNQTRYVSGDLVPIIVRHFYPTAEVDPVNGCLVLKPAFPQMNRVYRWEPGSGRFRGFYPVYFNSKATPANPATDTKPLSAGDV